MPLSPVLLVSTTRSEGMEIGSHVVALWSLDGHYETVEDYEVVVRSIIIMYI